MPPGYEDAKVHLEILGQEHELECKVRVGKNTRMAELLPVARVLSAKLVAISTEHVREEGKEVSCRKGCDHCCRQLVPVAPIEAKRLADLVAAMPKKRRAEIVERFARAIERVEVAGLLDAKAPRGRRALQSKEAPGSAAWEDVSRRYYELRQDCPFLEKGACILYDERPLACREYNAVTDPSLCEALDPGIESVPRPLRMGEVLTKVGNDLTGQTFYGVPLVLLLEWAQASGRAIEKVGDGEEMFWALLRVMEEAAE